MSSKILQRRPSLKEFEIFKQAEAAAADFTGQVLSRQIAWAEFEASGYLTSAQLNLMLEYDKHSASEKADLLAERGVEVARLLVHMLQVLNDENTVQYLLALVEDVLQPGASGAVQRERAGYFHALADSVAAGNDDESKHSGVGLGGHSAGHTSAYAPLLRIVSRRVEQAYTTDKACAVLALLFSTAPVRSANTRAEIEEFVTWLVAKLESSKGPDQLALVSAAKTLLHNSTAQDAFVNEGGLRPLCALMRKETQNTQLLYVTAFCFWQLTFRQSAHQQLLDAHVVSKVVDVLKSVLREKVVRVCFATLRNLLTAPHFREAMIAAGLLRVLGQLQGRKWTDDDLTNDMNAIDSELQSYVLVLSSYERYQAEVLSGKLEWSPVHNEKFWRENHLKFEDDNFSLIRRLVALLDSEDELTLQVACYDLGEFARFHPAGKVLIARTEGKRKILGLMNHAVADVGKQALLTVQKLMVNNWEALSSTSQPANGGAAAAAAASG